MSKETNKLVDGMSGIMGAAIRMNIYGKPSNDRDRVLADIIRELADHIGNKTLTVGDVMRTTEKLLAFCQAAKHEWEVIDQ